MITAQITMTGLGILCFNRRHAEIGIVEEGGFIGPRHSLKIVITKLQKIEKTDELENETQENQETQETRSDIDDGKKPDKIFAIEKVWPPDEYEMPLGEIRFVVRNPEITGVVKDTEDIDRLAKPTEKNRNSLKWLLDFEGEELHDSPVIKNPDRPFDFKLRKMVISNAYFYTASIREDSGYLIKKMPGGSVSRFGRIGHKLGAVLYGSGFELHIGGKKVFPVDGEPDPFKDENAYFQVLVTNLEENVNNQASDFSTYYKMISANDGEEFRFLSAPRFPEIDDKVSLFPGIDEEDVDKGVHYECWVSYRSSSNTIDDLI